MAIMTEIRRKLPLCPRKEADPPPNEAHRVHQISVSDIIPNRNQPRSAFHPGAINRLCESIKRYGILQPLTVRKVLIPTQESDGVRLAVYELVAGERRLRAAKQAGLSEVPCLIINTDDATSAELAIIENLLREDLNMFEQAEAFARLIDEFHLTQEEAARRVSMSQSAVANKLRILRLSPDERQRILSAGLTERHARALLKISDVCLRSEVLDTLIERKMNVSASEAYIDQLLTQLSRFETKQAPKAVEIAPNHLKSAQIDEKPSEMAQESVVYPDAESPRECDLELDEPLEEFPPAIRSVIAGRKGSIKGCMRDLRPFYNTIANAVEFLGCAGITGRVEKQESEREVRLTITLTKSGSAS